MDAMELIAAHDHLMDASNLPRYEKLIDANDALVAALEAILAQSAKHSSQWGQVASAQRFASDPDTAKAFAAARAALAKAQS